MFFSLQKQSQSLLLSPRHKYTFISKHALQIWAFLFLMPCIRWLAKLFTNMTIRPYTFWFNVKFILTCLFHSNMLITCFYKSSICWDSLINHVFDNDQDYVTYYVNCLLNLIMYHIHFPMHLKNYLKSHWYYSYKQNSNITFKDTSFKKYSLINIEDRNKYILYICC